MTWARAKKRLCEASHRFDETRMTVERFVAWINGPKDREDPDDILRGFDQSYGDLDATERAYFAERAGAPCWQTSAIMRLRPYGMETP